MISPNWLTSRVLKLWMGIILFCLIVYYIISSSDHSILPSISSIQHSSADLFHLAPTKETFISQIVENDIDGPFDKKPLVELCASKNPIPGLIFKCEPAPGGIGNVRNIILNCLRYAIEVGATSFILPTIVPVKGKGATTMDHFFDASHFAKHLSSSCPQMKLVSSLNDLWRYPSTSPPIIISPEKLTPQKTTQDPMQIYPPLWVPNFFSYLKIRHPSNFSAEVPVLVSLKTPLLLQWPLAYDTPTFVATFGRLLRLRRDVTELAAVTLWHMNEKYQLGIESRAGITQGQFYGAHLRTAKDARGAGWTPFSTQSTNYITHAMRYQLQVIYAASGNPDDLVTFAKKAKARGIAVTTKEQLLIGVEGEKLRSLGWDLRTCVDWEVMLRASQFGGIFESSWSWGIAARRHVVEGDGTWVANLDWKVDEAEDKSKRTWTRRVERAVPAVHKNRASARSPSTQDQAADLQTSNFVGRNLQFPKPKPAAQPHSQDSAAKPGAATDGAVEKGNGNDEDEEEEDDDEVESVDEGADGVTKPEESKLEVSRPEGSKSKGAKPEGVPIESAPSASLEVPPPSNIAPSAAPSLSPSPPEKATPIQATSVPIPKKPVINELSNPLANQQSKLLPGQPPNQAEAPTPEKETLDGTANQSENGTALNETAEAAGTDRYQEIQQQLNEEDELLVQGEGKGKEQSFQDRFSIVFGPVAERQLWFGSLWP